MFTGGIFGSIDSHAEPSLVPATLPTTWQSPELTSKEALLSFDERSRGVESS